MALKNHVHNFKKDLTVNLLPSCLLKLFYFTLVPSRIDNSNLGIVIEILFLVQFDTSEIMFMQNIHLIELLRGQ